MTIINRRFVGVTRAALIVAVLAAQTTLASAAPVVYPFDTFTDGTSITNQISGLTFAHTTVLTAGLSLNEFEFPPHSGDSVVFDDGGPTTIDFGIPVFSVGGYFTYVSGLTFSAYDSVNNLLGTDLASFVSNLALSGDVGSSPNEFLSVNDALGRITRVVITGASTGGSFTLDDLTVGAGNAVSEPPTIALVLGIFGMWGYLWRPHTLRRDAGCGCSNILA